MVVQPMRFPVAALFLFPILIAVLLVLAFFDGVELMVRYWSKPEYQHGYAIPLIAIYLLWIKSADLAKSEAHQSWAGALLVGVGIAVGLAGEISAIYTIIQYGFMLAVLGLAVTAVGWKGVGIIWAGLAYLLFMVPLPYFIQYPLTSELQLISSQLGAALLKLIGISVYVEGNVIDLGLTKLQVVEACSGLRYLFPLMSLGFLFAYLYRGPSWHKIIVFLSTVPITIFMNSFRIAMTGVLVNEFGVEVGDGFLHFFEGWVIFMACIAILLFELWVFSRFRPNASGDAFVVEVPPLDDLKQLFLPRSVGAPLIATTVLLAVGVLMMAGLGQRTEFIPERQKLSGFPFLLGDWTGREGALSADELDTLKLTDYMIMNYRNTEQRGAPIELYVAYYESQRKGASVHSPRACIPGGGWRIESLTQVALAGMGPNDEPLPVNRTVISKGQNRVLLYYWFEQRGRQLTNEYLVKWYIFWDSITRSRTDGALVRVSTFVPDPAEMEAADARLADFLGTAMPKLAYYLPGENAAPAQTRQASAVADALMTEACG